MRTMLAMLAALLLAGCAQTSLTISHNGEITATANTIDADKGAAIIKKMTENMKEICAGQALKLNPAISGEGASLGNLDLSSLMPSFGLKDIEKALGWLKKYLMWHAVTVIGKCENATS